jgi:DNA-binding protein HU-beta
MNKGDLVESVASQTNESKAQAARMVDAVLESIARGVSEDGRVVLAGFGSFERRVRPARKGVNPSTKQPMTIPETTTIGFKPSQTLRDSLARPAGGAAS